MRFIGLSAALAILLAGASCAQRGTAGEGRATPENTWTSLPLPSNPVPTGIPPAALPNQARPDGRVIDLKHVRWSRVVAADGRQIQVHYTITGRGDCAALGRVDVVETPQKVTITVLLGRLPGADCGGVQPQLAASMMTVVTLEEPLSNRTVVDGAAS